MHITQLFLVLSTVLSSLALAAPLPAPGPAIVKVDLPHPHLARKLGRPIPAKMIHRSLPPLEVVGEVDGQMLERAVVTEEVGMHQVEVEERGLRGEVGAGFVGVEQRDHEGTKAVGGFVSVEG